MKAWARACTLVALVTLMGCGGGGGVTPKASFERYKASMADKDFEAVWKMLASTSKEFMEDRAKKFAEEAKKAEGPSRTALEDEAKLMRMSLEEMKKLDGKALFIGWYQMAAAAGPEEWEKISRAEFSREEIDGDKAKVYVKIDGKEETDDPMPLVREEGRWKIDLKP
ncbi:MAG: hypothetical protein AMS16_02915 [Planctomycetes bacterium DG_58]|nr:MAG: hypothetical protein AMS16_02915 [Planctomycetes bacterium DG_58]KPL04464.1 MAG: hypothetical protein AMK75_01135 [Planctomycetes bacterium SM23_65]